MINLCKFYFLASFQRVVAAFLAISFRRFLLMASARALPPIRPKATAAGFLPSASGVGRTSAISPVAILAIITARAFTSAGRRSPLGPLGICLFLALLAGKHICGTPHNQRGTFKMPPTPINADAYGVAALSAVTALVLSLIEKGIMTHEEAFQMFTALSQGKVNKGILYASGAEVDAAKLLATMAMDMQMRAEGGDED